MGMMAAVIGGCDEAPTLAGGGGLTPADYVGAAGTRISFAPADAPDDPPLMLNLGEARWELREGDDWDSATAVATWEVSVGATLVAEGTKLLGPKLPDSAATETHYGTFEDTVSASPDAAPFAGRWVFAAGLGPVVLTVDGVERECGYYERLALEDTAAE